MNLISVPRHVFLLAAIVAAMLACARVASAHPCGTCPSGQCCDVAVFPAACVTATGGPTHCLAPDGVCQAPGEANCHCCDSSNTCVDSCPSGQCCDVPVGLICVAATGGPTHCLAPDGVCQAPGEANCPCCDSSNTCVTSCPNGQCCDVVAGLTCVTASGPPTNCLAPDGVCQAPGEANCPCCDGSNTCVSSCGSGTCVSGTCVFPPHEDSSGAAACSDSIDNDGDRLTDCADPDCGNTPTCGPVAPMMSHRVAIGLILTLSAVGLLGLWRAHRRAR